MRERRWPWVTAGLLMLGAAGALARSVYLHWLPCRGSYFRGTVFEGGRPSSEVADPAGWEGCLLRMDTGLPYPYPPDPAETTTWASGLGVLAMALVGAAWLIFVLSMRWSLKTTALALLPSLLTLGSAVFSAVAIRDLGRSEDDGSVWLWLIPDLAALVAFTAIYVWQPEMRGRRLVRLALMIWGITACGLVHSLFDYAFMVGFSDLNWDTPPLTGYLTVASLALSALLTVVLALAWPEKRLRDVSLPDPEPSRTLRA